SEDAQGGGGDGVSSGFKTGALAVGAALVVLWGLKRLLRRPS
ncbi:WD40 repeat domain-containing protein, partial [Streptomyces spongiae]|nr:WD40 repeat domain-containing protein [Streptomyces spongiae]